MGSSENFFLSKKRPRNIVKFCRCSERRMIMGFFFGGGGELL